LEKLVDEVLSLLRESAGPQELKIQRFNLAELLQDLVDTVNYEISEGDEQVELQTHSPLLLDADRDLLWRVFENLLRNALIHGTAPVGRNSKVHVTATCSSNREITVSVKDSGVGIAA